MYRLYDASCYLLYCFFEGVYDFLLHIEVCFKRTYAPRPVGSRRSLRTLMIPYSFPPSHPFLRRSGFLRRLAYVSRPHPLLLRLPPLNCHARHRPTDVLHHLHVHSCILGAPSAFDAEPVFDIPIIITPTFLRRCHSSDHPPTLFFFVDLTLRAFVVGMFVHVLCSPGFRLESTLRFLSPRAATIV